MEAYDFDISQEEYIEERLAKANTLNEMIDLYFEIVEQNHGEVIPQLEVLEERIKARKNTYKYIINKSFEYGGRIAGKQDQVRLLQASIKRMQNKQERLKIWANDMLARDGVNKQDLDCGSISIRKSKAVDVYNADILDSKYLVETVTTKPDKKKLKEDLKSGEIEGARIVENKNIQIKG